MEQKKFNFEKPQFQNKRNFETGQKKFDQFEPNLQKFERRKFEPNIKKQDRQDNNKFQGKKQFPGRL